MLHVHAAWEQADSWVAALLGLEQALSAGEDQVSPLEQFGLVGPQRRRGELEGGQLVHDVVDRRQGLKVAAERHRRGGVVPEHVTADVLLGEQPVQQRALRRDNLGRVEALW